MEKITIGLIDANWEHLQSNLHYATRGKATEFGFGPTATEALADLERREAPLQPKFDLGLAEEAAFLAIGAAVYLQEDKRDRSLDKYGGYCGLISEIISHAPALMNRLTQFSEGEFPGVWLYDVTERFGYEWAKALLEGDEIEPEELLEQIVSDELSKWELCQ